MHLAGMVSFSPGYPSNRAARWRVGCTSPLMVSTPPSRWVGCTTPLDSEKFRRANMAHVRQSRPDSGLDFQVICFFKCVKVSPLRAAAGSTPSYIITQTRANDFFIQRGGGREREMKREIGRKGGREREIKRERERERERTSPLASEKCSSALPSLSGSTSIT